MSRASKSSNKNIVVNLKKLGLETGKLYKFKGNYRKIYSCQKGSYKDVIDKIVRNEYLMFINAALKPIKRIRSTHCHQIFLKSRLSHLEANKYEILCVEPSTFSKYLSKVTFRSRSQEYNGDLYIGYGDKFGWVKIGYADKNRIMKDFSLVENTYNE